MSLSLRLMVSAVAGILILAAGCSDNKSTNGGGGGGGPKPKLFDSGNLTMNESFLYVFDSIGTFPYHCKIHGDSGGVGMSGTITVTAGGSPSLHQYNITSMTLPTQDIDIGDTMRWTNMQSITHTITSDK